MTNSALTFESMQGMVGQELGVSDWVTVDQARIDQFAGCTGDDQWIHVDVERAKRESPFGGPIAHGYLTLSLVAGLGLRLGAVPLNTQAAFNYGLDKVRFLTPVKAGARVRLRCTLMALESKGPGQYLMKTSNTIEIEGSDKPALVAETLAMLYEGRGKKAG